MAAADWLAPPTYELPISLNEVRGDRSDPIVSQVLDQLAKAQFSPNWLKWFLDLAQVLTAVGAGGGGIEHNLLSGLQGGTVDEYYHLTSAQHTNLFGNQSANTYYAGPTTGAAAAPTFRAGVAADITFIATDRLLGRSTALAGKGEEIVCTAAGRALLDDASASAQRTTLGLGTGDSPQFTGLTLTGNLSVQGNTTLGNASGDTLTIAPNAITWSNAPTHSNDHIFSGGVSVQGGTNPSVGTVSGHFLWEVSNIPGHTFIDSSRSANNRLIDFAWQSGVFYNRFAADNYGAVVSVYEATGGQAAGLSTLTFPSAVSSIFGHTASVTVGNAGKVQVVGTTDATGQSQISRHSADSSGPIFATGKSRNASAGGNTIVQSGDVLGQWIGLGADGTNYDAGAAIRMEVDGTPGAGTDMPGRIVALTSPDGTATLTEAWRVDNAQKHIFQVDRAVRFNNQTDGAGVAAGTLLNAPTAGDPGFWLKINIGGTNYAVPCWAG